MKKIRRIPKFKTEAAEARFWDRHSVTDFAGELSEVRGVKFPKPRKRLISLRIDDTQIRSLKRVAAAKDVGYLTLIRMWVAERLTKENRILHAHR